MKKASSGVEGIYLPSSRKVGMLDLGGLDVLGDGLVWTWDV